MFDNTISKASQKEAIQDTSIEKYHFHFVISILANNLFLSVQLYCTITAYQIIKYAENSVNQIRKVGREGRPFLRENHGLNEEIFELVFN